MKKKNDATFWMLFIMICIMAIQTIYLIKMFHFLTPISTAFTLVEDIKVSITEIE